MSAVLGVSWGLLLALCAVVCLCGVDASWCNVNAVESTGWGWGD